MIKDINDAMVEVYGKNWQEQYTVKSDEELKAAPAKKSPRAIFKEGDKIHFFVNTLIVSKEETIGKWTGNVDTFAAVLERDGVERNIRFFVSWLDKVGYAVYAYGDNPETCLTSKQDTPITGRNSGNVGELVDAWQSCANQFECKKLLTRKEGRKVVGRVVEVTFAGYFMTQFDDTPKPKLRFTFID